MSKSEFLISGIETGQLNAMVKNVMLQTGIKDPKEAVRMLNAGELTIQRKWREKNGIIYFSVTSDGTTGEHWIKRLEDKEFILGSGDKSILLSEEFKPTSCITYEIAVLKGEIFSEKENIYTKASELGFLISNVEVAFLIRDKFSDKELEVMGICWIVVMHEPIENLGTFRLFSLGRGGGGHSVLRTRCADPGSAWDREDGFAFIASQVNS